MYFKYIYEVHLSISNMYLKYSKWPQVSHKHGGSIQNLQQKSRTKKTYISIQKRINVISNVQYFVQKYFPAIIECS